MSRLNILIEASKGGDRRAGELLIEENSGLIWSVAKRFLGRGVEADDLYQLGCLGFLKAVDGFDAGYGTQFSTYAVPKIAGEIRRFLRDDGTIKVSRTIKERSASIKTARNLLTNSLGREPTLSELSEQMGIPAEDIAMAEAATSATESIQRESSDEGFTLEKILTDTESEEKMVERLALRQALEHLPEREATVVKLRYYHGMTQERIAKVLSVSQVQISRIEKKALEKLRQHMA